MNQTDRNGNTPFHYVCKNGHLKFVNLFMQKSAELEIVLDAENFQGCTPFLEACRFGHFMIAHDLVNQSSEFDIELNVKNEFHNTGTIWIPEMINNTRNQVEVFNQNQLKNQEH